MKFVLMECFGELPTKLILDHHTRLIWDNKINNVHKTLIKLKHNNHILKPKCMSYECFYKYMYGFFKSDNDSFVVSNF